MTSEQNDGAPQTTDAEVVAAEQRFKEAAELQPQPQPQLQPAPSPEERARAELMALPSDIRSAAAAKTLGWGNMSWARRLKVVRNPPAQGPTEEERKAAAYDAQYSSNGAWGGKEWWEDSDSD